MISEPGYGAPAPPPRVTAERRALRSETAGRFGAPVFLVAPPGSGTEALQAALAKTAGVWTVAEGSDAAIAGVPSLHPSQRGWDSERLTSADAGHDVAEALRRSLLTRLRDRDGREPDPDVTDLRIVDAPGAGALRVEFLASIWPRALFLYLRRDAGACLAEMLTAWRSGGAVTHAALPDWPGPPWSLLLTPGWRELRGAELESLVAAQWGASCRVLLDDLERLPAQRVHVLEHSGLHADPARELARICEFAGLAASPGDALARLSADSAGTDAHADPDPDPPQLREIAARARSFHAARRKDGAGAGRGQGARANPLRSVNTSNLPAILDQLGCSLLITTYQTGRLICARRTATGLNTHFRGFETPMGVAWKAPKLAIGTQSQVWEYRDLPAVAAKLEPAPEPHDACLIPRRVHYTGDIRVHDIAYAGGELWVVATRFSCLATLDAEHSFVPRWRPPFVSALAGEDRCHLNGLAVVDEEVRYVTALGESDSPGGWRENKASGGILIDVRSSETVLGGLSMPHSPRWYRDRLWLLESGRGTLSRVDLETGEAETVVELPGFTRGLAFAGPLAFVGLSQVREATTFGGLPLTARLEERQCGVWVVNIESGEVIAFLRFEDLVQEIFDVAVLPGLRFPEIAEHGSDAANLSYLLPDEALAGS